MVHFPHKVCIPQRPSYLVSRDRLVQHLKQIADRRLITVSAPAGYGKTSTLIDFANTPFAIPICWYSLDSSDQDQWVFLSYVTAAIDHRFPGAVQLTQQVLKDRAEVSFCQGVTALTHDMYALNRDVVLIIDDWHLVDGQPEIRDVVSHLLLRCPQFRLILASRTYPSLPNIMLLTARREVSGLSEHHLRFTTEEACAVIQAEYQVPIRPELIETITTRANGWITSILLTYQSPAITSHQEPAPGEPHVVIEQQVYRFMAEQVFDALPGDLREFLINTALLDEFTVEQCQSILQYRDAKRLIDSAVRQHLFISEVRPGWYRYHAIFQEFLKDYYRNTDPEGFRVRISQVAGVYAARGQWHKAFDQYIIGENYEAAQHVVEHTGQELLRKGRLETLGRWFSQLDTLSLSVPLLCLYAQVMVGRGNYQEAQALADRAFTRTTPEQLPAVLLIQAQVLRITGYYSLALSTARQLLDVTIDSGQRVAGYRVVGLSLLMLGDTDGAIEAQKEALAIARNAGDLHAVAYVQRDLGLCYKSVGALSTAEYHYTQAVAYWTSTNNTGLRALSLNSIGSAQHLAGRYQKAYETITSALYIVREVSLPSYESTILSCLGDLFSDLQLWERAEAAYTDARRLGGTAQLLCDLDIAQAQVRVRQGEYDDALRVLRNLPDATLRSRPVEILLLRGHIACGMQQYAEADAICTEMFSHLAQQRQPINLARAYLLQARVNAGLFPAQTDLLIAALQRTAQILEELNHGAFIIPDTLLMRSVLRRAATSGWPLAEEWMRRQHDLLLVTEELTRDDQRPVLQVQTFGVDHIALNGEPVRIGWQKAREALYYLLSQPDGVQIDVLRETIWPDMPAERSREALRSAVYQLRSLLPRDLIELQGRQIYRINRQVARIDSDVEQFLALLAANPESPDGLFDAVDLYRGPYLSTIESEWCGAIRSHLEQRYLLALQTLASWHEAQQMVIDALHLYQRILAVNLFDEVAHAGAMRCFIALGNRSAAIAQYQKLSRLLDEELGLYLESSSEVEQLYRRMLTVS